MSKPHSSLEKWMDASFRSLVRFEWTKIKEEPRIAILWMVEILLSVGIAAAIAVYVDPDLNVVPAPWNYATFLILVSAAVFIHRQTRPFRVTRRLKKRR